MFLCNRNWSKRLNDWNWETDVYAIMHLWNLILDLLLPGLWEYVLISSQNKSDVLLKHISWFSCIWRNLVGMLWNSSIRKIKVQQMKVIKGFNSRTYFSSPLNVKLKPSESMWYLSDSFRWESAFRCRVMWEQPVLLLLWYFNAGPRSLY